MRNAIFPLIAVLALAACTASRKAGSNVDLLQLKDQMTGTFNSAAQAARDSNYYDITLHMYLGDNGKARRDLGYNPRPLREGLKETLEYELKQMGK